MITARHPIPGLPAGYTSRGVDPTRDVALVTELCNAAALVEGGANELDEKVQEESYRAPGFDPQRDALVVLDGTGRIVATAEYWDNEEEHATPFLYLRVGHALVGTDDGAHIGAAMAAWGDARAALTLQLAAPELKVVLSSVASAANEPAQRILEGAGFRYARSSWQMQIDLGETPPPPATWPDGISVRSAEPTEAEYHAILVVQNDAFADHYGFVPMSFRDFVHYGTRMTPFDPSLWRLVMEGEELVAISLNMSFRPGAPDVGWVGTLGVRRPWRRRGLGEALLRDAFALFHARGTRHVGLGVDASNLTGATRLYERVGMRVMRENRNYEKVLREGRDVRTIELAGGAG